MTTDLPPAPPGPARSSAQARAGARRAVQPASEVDFGRRADPASLPEWMDEPCPYEQFRDCVRDLGSVNRLTLAYAPTLSFLARIADEQGGIREPLRILDVGSGGGDTLRRIALWAARRKLPVQLTGIDLNPHATRAAHELSSRNPRFAAIRWITGDACAQPAVEAYDVVLSSLVTHHLPDAEIVRLLTWMEHNARLGWFISDLLRSRRSYRLFQILAAALRWHPFVQHDGPVSIRRGFRTADWQHLLSEAQIPADDVAIAPAFPGRLCVSRFERP